MFVKVRVFYPSFRLSQYNLDAQLSARTDCRILGNSSRYSVVMTPLDELGDVSHPPLGKTQE